MSFHHVYSSRPVPMHRQSKTNSTSVIPQPYGLQKYGPCPPRMNGCPRAICRDFIYRGFCEDWRCPRAHVPNMHDLFEVLLKRDDCPLEVRSIQTSSFSRPVFGRSRYQVQSDIICYGFLNGTHDWPYCHRAHLRPAQIYGSLLRNKETTTSADVPVNVADGAPVVKLPTGTNFTSPNSFQLDNIPPIVRLPESSTPNGQSSLVESPFDTIVSNSQSARPQRASLDRLREKERQPNRPETPHNIPESIISSDSNSSVSNSTFADGSSVGNTTVCSTLSATNLAPATAPPKLPRQLTEPRVCFDWLDRRCNRLRCKFLHPPHEAHGDDIADPHGPHTARQSEPSTTRILTTDIPTELDPAVIVAVPPITPYPPRSQQKPAAVGPPAQAKTSSSQVCPSKSQEQPPLPKSTPLEEMTLSVMESTKVKFSAGFSIKEIVTGFESPWIVIEDIPSTVDRAVIERLVAPFGKVRDIQDRRSDNPGSKAFNVQMATYREAVLAINGLDGKDTPEGHMSVQLSLSRHLTKRMLRDNYVCVSWRIPCKAGYAGYDTLEAAQSAVSKADGKTERGYWITASMYQSIPIIDAYNVRFTGLPPGVEQKFLDKFGPSADTMLERPNYQAPEFGIPAVRRTLENFGKIVHFNPIPPPYKDGFARVWCQFESPDVARAACELNHVKQRALGMERIRVRRVLSVLEHVPHAKFDLVEEDLCRLREKLWDLIPGAHLAIIPPYEHDTARAVRLVANDSKTLVRLRGELKGIVDGEIVKENGQQVWDDFLRGEAGSHFVARLRECNPRVMILVQLFHRCVRLIGTVEKRQAVATAILAKLTSLRQDKVHTIHLDNEAMGVVTSPELAAAQQRHGEDNIRINFQRHVLLVRGTNDLYEEVQQIVHVVKARHVGDFGDDHCPVCLDPPLTSISLSCGHRWCKACLAAYLTAAADTRSFPISCLGKQGRCTELIPMRVVCDVLPPADFDALASAAFHAYVQARPGEYHYCPTPDCPQAYPTGPRNAPLSCPSCLARICSSCHVEYHEGVTCADREDGGDRLFQEWMRIHDVKNCPGCHAPIEHGAGCNHITCTRCRTHTCWQCLKTFPQGQGIYDHMREVHGGIGL